MRLQRYGPHQYVKEARDSELRLVFNNGSYIVLDGCENYDPLRGIKPNLVIYDEFQHHTKHFDEEVMQPNLASGSVSLVVMGTPPKRVCYYTEFRDFHLDKIRRGDTSRFYVELPSEANPKLDKAWLAGKKQDLIEKGRYNVWLREYEGKLVLDTEAAIFPFFDIDKHGQEKEELKRILERDKRRLNYFTVFDPGTATVFAALFCAYNPYSGQVFILDEIYAKDRQDMTARAIWQKAMSIQSYWLDESSKWLNYYDEAATWFLNEVTDLYRNSPDFSGLIPTHKQRAKTLRAESDGRAGESIIDSLMLEPKKFTVSLDCENFLWELDNYVKDEDGNYPRTHDHLIDCLYYFIQNCNIELSLKPDTIARDDEFEFKRTRTPVDLLRTNVAKRDIAASIQTDYYDDGDISDIWRE